MMTLASSEALLVQNSASCRQYSVINHQPQMQRVAGSLQRSLKEQADIETANNGTIVVYMGP